MCYVGKATKIFIFIISVIAIIGLVVGFGFIRHNTHPTKSRQCDDCSLSGYPPPSSAQLPFPSDQTTSPPQPPDTAVSPPAPPSEASVSPPAPPNDSSLLPPPSDTVVTAAPPSPPVQAAPGPTNAS